MRACVLALLYCLFPVLLFSQQQEGGSLSGKLIDSLSGKPLPLATIAVFSARDTVLITYRMSNNEGVFKVPGLPLHQPLRLLISYSGYAVHRAHYLLSAASPQANLGAIPMQRDNRSLEEVLVLAERPPIMVRKDTIEFNAAAFKTLPAALVEDLLKKLPGIFLDADGNIAVNGKRVNRILVDGKEFFGGDIKMATRNLPANIIDKVQVTHDERELEENPDRSKASIGQVINLKLKKGIKQGWFGKAYAGGGTDERYEAGTILNLFRDTLQVSVLGFTNNLNRPGFGYSDIRRLGGFDRSGVSSISTGNGGLTINGISFGGSGEGVQVSSGAGFNLNNVFKKNITLNTQYFYGRQVNDIVELNNRQQFIRDTVLETRSLRNEMARYRNHRVNFSLRIKASPSLRIEFRPGLVLASQHSDRYTGSITKSNLAGPLNASDNGQQLKAEDIGYSHVLSSLKTFTKKGRSFSLHQLVNSQHTNQDQYNNVQNILYPSDTAYLYQLRDRVPANTSAITTLTYQEPLFKGHRLKLSYALQYLRHSDALLTLHRSPANGKYEEVKEPLSNGIVRNTWRHHLAAAWVWNFKALTVTGSANFYRLLLNNRFQKNNPSFRQYYNYLFPGIALDWKELSMEYSVAVNPPSIADLQPVPDNTNPLFINNGNPHLQPVTVHNLYLNFYKTLPAQSLTLVAYLNANLSSNGIIRARQVDAKGVQTTTPQNAAGLANAFSQASISKQYKVHNHFQWSVTAGYQLNHIKHLLLVNELRSIVRTTDLNGYVRSGINWKDKIEWNLSYSRGSYSTRYENKGFDPLRVRRQVISTDMVIRWPRKWVWETSFDHRYNSQVAAGVQKTVGLLNAGIIYLFLQEDKGQLKLTVFDLLDQNVAVTRHTADNFINDRQINILRRYFLLSVTYNIRNFKNTRVGGRQSLFLF